MKKVILSLLVAMFFSATVAVASQEQTQTSYAYMTDFRVGSPMVGAIAGGNIEIEAEAIHVPNASNSIGVRHEPVEDMPFIGRLRTRVFPSDNYFIGAGVMAPVEFEGYEYGFVAAELGAMANLTPNITLGARTYYAYSDIEGDVTAANDELAIQQAGIDANLGVSLFPIHASLGGGSGMFESVLTAESGTEYELNDQTYNYITGAVSYNVSDRTRLSYSQNFTNGGKFQHWTFNATQSF